MAQIVDIHAQFVKGAVESAHFLESSAPEVAMVGRSNVGKSSLINAIVRHGNLARVSNTPGKTQEINFFTTDAGFVLVDLPGYGYARVSKEQRQLFSDLIRSYLLERENLAVTFILVDSRHEPMPIDLAMIEELEFAGRPYVVVLTKCDKRKEGANDRRLDEFRQLLSQCRYLVDIILTSAKTGDGRSSMIGIMKRMSQQFNEAAP
jgi:GTP-binding protein